MSCVVRALRTGNLFTSNWKKYERLLEAFEKAAASKESEQADSTGTDQNDADSPGADSWYRAENSLY